MLKKRTRTLWNPAKRDENVPSVEKGISHRRREIASVGQYTHATAVYNSNVKDLLRERTLPIDFA